MLSGFGPTLIPCLKKKPTSVRGEAGAVHGLVENLDGKQECLLQIAALLVLLLQDALRALWVVW